MHKTESDSSTSHNEEYLAIVLPVVGTLILLMLALCCTIIIISLAHKIRTNNRRRNFVRYTRVQNPEHEGRYIRSTDSQNISLKQNRLRSPEHVYDEIKSVSSSTIPPLPPRPSIPTVNNEAYNRSLADQSKKYTHNDHVEDQLKDHHTCPTLLHQLQGITLPKTDFDIPIHNVKIESQKPPNNSNSKDQFSCHDTESNVESFSALQSHQDELNHIHGQPTPLDNTLEHTNTLQESLSETSVCSVATYQAKHLAGSNDDTVIESNSMGVAFTTQIQPYEFISGYEEICGYEKIPA